MGGSGSGNWGDRSRHGKTTDMRALDARRLKRHGMLARGHAGPVVWRWSDTGEETGRIDISVTKDVARLVYKHRRRGANWQSADYHVPILRTPCHLGGERAWWACPCCGRRVPILYGGHPFACRACHGLTYPSQRVGRSDRAIDMAHDLRSRLGSSPGLGEPESWNRPKGMHRATFARHVERYMDLEAASWADMIERHVLAKDADFCDILASAS
jgi:hypothetical protein